MRRHIVSDGATPPAAVRLLSFCSGGGGLFFRNVKFLIRSDREGGGAAKDRDADLERALNDIMMMTTTRWQHDGNDFYNGYKYTYT